MQGRQHARDLNKTASEQKPPQRMKTSEKQNYLKWNTLLWLVAMLSPAVFSFAFASTKFPWPIVVPFLLFGCLLASNRMLTMAIGPTTDEPSSKSANG